MAALDPVATPRKARRDDIQSSPTLHATSVIKRFGASTTLPRNFAPLSLDRSELPTTPDQIFALPDLPPPPPHSSLRIRRPRVNLDHFQRRSTGLPTTLFASEIPAPSSAGPWITNYSDRFNSLSSDDILPTIESSSSPSRPRLLHTVSEPLSGHKILLQNTVNEPCTPSTQTMKTPAEIKRGEWDLHRPTSACSNASGSSSLSARTCETRPTSYDGSEIGKGNSLPDPFGPEDEQNDQIRIVPATPTIPATPTRRSKKLRLGKFLGRDSVEWTIDMDNHLFNIYQIYLADPIVTPFKTVPGSIPPTGVCHRVARRAKETWPHATRIETPIVQRYKVRSMLDVQITPRRARTPDVENFLSTPIENKRKPWPSEKATRKRLKQLCREKFTISAHYNRLRESRSPSPFAEQFAPRHGSRFSTSPVNENAAFATRQMHIDLVSTGATAPLAQLTTGDSPVAGELEKFNQRIDADEAAASSESTGLGIQHNTDDISVSKQKDNKNLGVDIPRLASPFAYNTWNGSGKHENPLRKQLGHSSFGTLSATTAAPRLLSPFEPDQGMVANIHKRRATNTLEDELSPSGSSLAGHTLGLNLDSQSVASQDPMQISPIAQRRSDDVPDLVFSGPGDIGNRRVRIRNRGATISAHERISRLFSPSLENAEDGDVPPIPAIPAQFAQPQMLTQSQSLRLPQVEKRLGSPFELDMNRRSLRGTKTRHLPSLSDPFISFTHGTNAAGLAEVSRPKTSQVDQTSSASERLTEFQRQFQAFQDGRPEHT